jgi:hypothetical protein
MVAVLPLLAALMFGLVGVYGWRVFSEPEAPPATKPKQPRRRRQTNARRRSL